MTHALPQQYMGGPLSLVTIWAMPNFLPAPCREAVLPAGSFGKRPVATSSRKSYGGNLPHLQDAALAVGHFNPLVDFDGIFRRIPLLAEYQAHITRRWHYLSYVPCSIFHPSFRALLKVAKNTPGWNGSIYQQKTSHCACRLMPTSPPSSLPRPARQLSLRFGQRRPARPSATRCTRQSNCAGWHFRTRPG